MEIDWYWLAVGVFGGFSACFFLYGLAMRQHNKRLDEITAGLEQALVLAESVRKQAADIAIRSHGQMP